jgi:hypothetical protein
VEALLNSRCWDGRPAITYVCGAYHWVLDALEQQAIVAQQNDKVVSGLEDVAQK